MKQSALPPNDQEMTLVQHLLELRNSVTKSVIAIAVMFLILFPFANDIYTFIAEPLTRYLPDNTSMIAVGVASPFLTPFKLSLVLAIYLAMPFLLYQLWSFIAPALYSHEKQLVGPVLFFSSFLFYAGGAFSYFVVFPLVFGFLSQTAPEGVTIATDIALYLDFVIKMFFAFGLAFEVPVITVLLILTGMVKPKTMSHARPYVIVAAFVLGMLLTPPDIISQTLLAVPVWLLYELGIIIGTIILKRKGLDKSEAEAEETAYEHEPSSKSYQGSAQKFDRGFAEQNSKSSDDDFDFDSEFDKIEREMAALRNQSTSTKSNDTEGKSSDDQQEPKGPNK
ncbi:twin-arginine translocase subunit TatC [Thiomicrospira cyclica]|uniref:Sec-independent protein translocase protein TatC n=1 Tax=Thiomicrospira cyclica (strain DSM 14477 / JCM 11371 / ALM1) TaxID=717773 RepID=F6DAW9_THICA|nr:twin-arginine translocase subunit TatC [Thiomicrospira cyclica]AEG32302.1 Sec-independent protein translocase, TatC subunit [Thiomicrospira cyclica ALM1]